MSRKSPGTGRADNMDAASRREFFGEEGRPSRTAETPITPIHGNGLDKPYAPDPNHDRPLSRHTD